MTERDKAPAAELTDLPAIDFSTFILSLSTTALYQMGLAPDPSTGHAIDNYLKLLDLRTQQP